MYKKTSFLLSIIVIGLLFSCGGLPTSTLDETSSTLTNSSFNSRRPVSEMMATISNTSYTLTLKIDGVNVYEYSVDQPLIDITYYDVYADYESRYFVNLSNINAPKLYEGYEDNNWFVSPANPNEILSLLSPLSFIDPSLIQDDWFIWNESMDGYGLNEIYLDDLFENSPLNGVENLSIWMTNTGNLIIQIGGRMGENEVEQIGIELIYSDVGTTEVTLPTSIIDLRTTAIDDLLRGSTNHTYQMFFSSLTEATNALPSIYQYGERNGDTFRTNTYTYDGNGGTYFDKYVSPSNDQYTEISGFNQNYSQFSLDELAYQEALKAFYPTNILALEESWFDIENETYLSSYGVTAFPIEALYYEDLINASFVSAPTILQAFVGIEQAFYTWSGAVISLYITIEINSLPYQLNFQISSFNRVESVYVPMTSSIENNLFESLSVAVSTSSYFLQQYQLDATNTDTIDLQAVRSGDNYQVFSYTNEGYLDVDYYGVEGDQYVQFSYVYMVGDYEKSLINEETYRKEVLESQWIDLEKINQDDIEPVINEPGVYQLNLQNNASIFSSSFEEEYQINEIRIYYSNLDVGLPMIVFEIKAIDRATNQPMTLEARYSYLGLTDVVFPMTKDENPPVEETFLTIDNFNALNPNGINSYIGTLYSFDNEGDIHVYLIFSSQSDEVLIIDRYTGDYSQYLQENDQYIKMTGSFDNEDITNEVVDKAEFDLAKNSIQFVNFSMFNADHLTMITQNLNSVVYQVNLDAIDGLLNLPLPEGYEISEIIVEITNGYLYFQIIAFHSTTNATITSYLVLEALNQSVDLLPYF